MVFHGLNAALLSISGTSANEVYAVGADPDDGLGPYVLAFDGQQWRRLETGLTGHLWWISVVPIDGAFYLAGTAGKVVRFTPSNRRFEQLPTPGGQTIYGVWGTGADDLWAVGGDEDQPDHGGVIWRYDGTAWSVVDLAAVMPGGVPTLYKVWGRSRDDVYAVGRLGLLLHFDGAAWSIIPSGTTHTLITIHGSAALTMATGGFAEGVILEQSGTAFTNVAPAGTPRMIGVFVPHTAPAVAVGVEASLLLRQPGGWQLQQTGFNTQRDFHTVWVDPDGGIWAVGGDLSINLRDGMLAYIGSAVIPTQVAP